MKIIKGPVLRQVQPPSVNLATEDGAGGELREATRRGQRATMKRQLQITIDSGDKTCARAPGEFCQYVLVRRYGLFRHEDGREIVLEDDDGWLERCDPCLNAEAEACWLTADRRSK